MRGADRTATPAPTMYWRMAATTPAPSTARRWKPACSPACATRMMTPEIAAEAMRAYAEETNRLNRERRNSVEATRRELADTEKAIPEIVRVIEQGGYHRALSDRLTELEAKQDTLNARLSDAPADIPDIHPEYRRDLPAQDRAPDRSARPSRRRR